MATPIFESEQDRLDWLVHSLLENTNSGLKIIPKSGDDLDVLMLATAIVRLGLSYAQGVNSLLEVGQVDATPPLQRALYEIWIEFRYFLRSGNAAQNAVKFTINAMKEVENFTQGREEQFGEYALEHMRKGIATYKAQYPEAYTQIEEQRRRRKYHWSGMSISGMERAVAPGSSMYKMLSWEAHLMLSPIRDVTIDIENAQSATFKFQPQNTPTTDPEFVAYSVGGMLFMMWNEYAKFFDLPLIVADNQDDQVSNESCPPS